MSTISAAPLGGGPTSNLSAGNIVGVVAGSLIGVAVLFFLVVFLLVCFFITIIVYTMVSVLNIFLPFSSVGIGDHAVVKCEIRTLALSAAPCSLLHDLAPVLIRCEICLRPISPLP